MQAEAPLEDVELLCGRLDEPDPYELGLVLRTDERLVQRDRLDPLAVAIEIGGDDRHPGPRFCAGL
jgi:hypothetical protein